MILDVINGQNVDVVAQTSNLEITLSIFTIFVTIIGFIVTYIIAKKQIKNEMRKQKLNITLSKLDKVLYDLVTYMHKIKKGNIDVNEFAEILHTIYAYGSKKIIMLTLEIQKTNYNFEKSKVNELLVMYSLLISQIKYELTEEVLSPEAWFILNISDYNNGSMKQEVIKIIDEKVDFYKLNKGFKIPN